MSERRRLVGRWRLLRYTERGADGAVRDVFGTGVKGTLAYFADGTMMVLVVGEGRPRLRGAWSAIPAGDKAAAYDRLIAYAGRWSLRGDRVVHHVEQCWIPNWEGKDLERLVVPQDADRMILRTEAAAPQDLLWERIA